MSFGLLGCVCLLLTAPSFQGRGHRGQLGLKRPNRRTWPVRQTHTRYLNSVASCWATCGHDYSAGFITNLCHVSLCGSCVSPASRHHKRSASLCDFIFPVADPLAPVYFSERSWGYVYTRRLHKGHLGQCEVYYKVSLLYSFVGPLSRRGPGDAFDYYNSTLPAQGHSTRVQKSTPKRRSTNPVLRNGNPNFLIFLRGVAALTRNRALRRPVQLFIRCAEGQINSR